MKNPKIRSLFKNRLGINEMTNTYIEPKYNQTRIWKSNEVRKYIFSVYFKTNACNL